MTFQEAEIRANELAEKGKADFFIRDTLLKEGFDQDIVNQLFDKLIKEKNERSKKDKLIGYSLTILGIVWIYLIFKFDLKDFFIFQLPFSKLILFYGPIATGVLFMIKGHMKLKKLI